MKKRTKVIIRKSDKKIFINISNSKNGVIVEADDFSFESGSKYHTRYSSKWFAFKSIFSMAFSLSRKTPEIKIDSFNTSVDSFIKKNVEAIFVGLEALGFVDRNIFYSKNELSFHRDETKWLVKEFSRLNKEKFIKYIKKHLKTN